MASTAPPPPGSTYTFASQPRAVASQRQKYRDPRELQSAQGYGNMMHDPRIVRGSTLRRERAGGQADAMSAQKQRAKRSAARKRTLRATRGKSSDGPAAVAGRQHMEVQTELYLEELSDRVEETDVQTQTDPFLDRPPSPLFIPAKSGIDVATQIEDGELFDFELEVKPILQVLVGKTVEQALMEVMEEEELENLRSHQRQYQELRAAELAEAQRLEERQRRHREEKERRMAEAREAKQREHELAEKVAARAFAQSYLSELVPSVFGSLEEGGYFYDAQEREVETEFIPWLMDAVDESIEKQRVARRILDDIIRDMIKQRMKAHNVGAAARSASADAGPAVEDDATPCAAPTAEPASSGDGTSADEVQAATKIQAHYRGYQTRKQRRQSTAAAEPAADEEGGKQPDEPGAAEEAVPAPETAGVEGEASPPEPAAQEAPAAEEQPQDQPQLEAE